MSKIIGHDFRKAARGWGHNIASWDTIDGGNTVDIIGWTAAIAEGDLMLFDGPSGPGRISFYRVRNIEYWKHPPDMFKATVEYACIGNLTMSQEDLKALPYENRLIWEFFEKAPA